MKLSKQIKREMQEYLKDRLGSRVNRTQIVAPYQLSEKEVLEIQSKVPLIKDSEVEIIVDKTIMAGIIIKQGSRLIDYSLKSKVDSLFTNQ